LALAVPSARRPAEDHREIRDLIRRLAKENSNWGAPKVHAELQKLGFTVAERTVARYLRRISGSGDPKQKWLGFLQNHREVIGALVYFNQFSDNPPGKGTGMLSFIMLKKPMACSDSS
jgi:thioesterase domain-containing protein